MNSIGTDRPQRMGEWWKYLGSPWRIIRAYGYIAGLCLVLFFAVGAEATEYLFDADFQLVPGAQGAWPTSKEEHFQVMRPGTVVFAITTAMPIKDSALWLSLFTGKPTYVTQRGLHGTVGSGGGLSLWQLLKVPPIFRLDLPPVRIEIPVTEEDLLKYPVPAWRFNFAGDYQTIPSYSLRGHVTVSLEGGIWDRDRRDPKLPSPKPRISDPIVDPRGKMLDKATPPPPSQGPPLPPR